MGIWNCHVHTPCTHTHTHKYSELLPFKSVVCTLLTIDLYYIGKHNVGAWKCIETYTASSKKEWYFLRNKLDTQFSAPVIFILYFCIIFLCIFNSRRYTPAAFFPSTSWLGDCQLRNKNLYFYFFHSLFSAVFSRLVMN